MDPELRGKLFAPSVILKPVHLIILPRLCASPSLISHARVPAAHRCLHSEMAPRTVSTPAGLTGYTYVESAGVGSTGCSCLGPFSPPRVPRLKLLLPVGHVFCPPESLRREISAPCQIGPHTFGICSNGLRAFAVCSRAPPSRLSLHISAGRDYSRSMPRPPRWVVAGS